MPDYEGAPTPPTAEDITAAAHLLGVPEGEVRVLVPALGGYVTRTIAETAGELPCEDCGAGPGIPCDVTVEH